LFAASKGLGLRQQTPSQPRPAGISPLTAGCHQSELANPLAKEGWDSWGAFCAMQIELFNTDRYGVMALPWKRRLKSRGLPALQGLVQNENIWIGELCAMEDEAHQEGCPEIFDRFMSDVEALGLPAKLFRSLMPAWRYKQNPLTAAKVAHLHLLGQVKGKMDSEQLGIPSSSVKVSAEPATPNKLAAPINFNDLSSGGALTPHLAGKIGEDSVEGVLKRLGISYTPQFIAPFIGWGKSKQSRVDFKVAAFDDEPLDKGFYMEVKWRNRQRSADDDLTALLHNIEAWYDLPTIVLYDGEGAVRDAYETVRHQMEQKRRKLSDKLLSVMTFNEFVLFAQTQLGQQMGVAA
jgi:hypothetical protein